MTVEGQNAPVENKKKYENLQKFISEHEGKRIVIMGDMKGHTGILGKRMNGYGEMLIEFVKRCKWKF